MDLRSRWNHCDRLGVRQARADDDGSRLGHGQRRRCEFGYGRRGHGRRRRRELEFERQRFNELELVLVGDETGSEVTGAVELDEGCWRWLAGLLRRRGVRLKAAGSKGRRRWGSDGAAGGGDDGGGAAGSRGDGVGGLQQGRSSAERWGRAVVEAVTRQRVWRRSRWRMEAAAQVGGRGGEGEHEEDGGGCASGWSGRELTGVLRRRRSRLRRCGGLRELWAAVVGAARVGASWERERGAGGGLLRRGRREGGRRGWLGFNLKRTRE